jgi:hypothetical protein
LHRGGETFHEQMRADLLPMIKLAATGERQRALTDRILWARIHSKFQCFWRSRRARAFIVRARHVSVPDV